EGRQINRDEAEKPAAPAGERVIRHGAEKSREAEERPGHGLRRAIAREKRLLADESGLDDRFLQQRQHDMPAAEDERAGAVEIREKQRGAVSRHAGRKGWQHEQQDEQDEGADRNGARDQRREPLRRLRLRLRRQKAPAEIAAQKDRGDLTLRRGKDKDENRRADGERRALAIGTE